jgi:hypothetical protein
MFNKDSILSFLDHSFEATEMPSLGNMNIDYVSLRLSIYRSEDGWLLLFNSVVWWPSLVGLMAMVEVVGTGVVGRQGFDNGQAFEPGCIKFEEEEEENILSIVIRGKDIDLSSLDIQPNYKVQPEYGFWASTVLAEHYKESLLASQSEIQQFIPPDFQHLLTIDEWDHPKVWDTLPSQTVAFPLIADILVTSDSSLWKPVEMPNTHWSNWLPK